MPRWLRDEGGALGDRNGVPTDHEHAIRWSVSGPLPAGVTTDLVFIGSGEHALEVALAHSSSRPRAEDVRRLWKARHGGRPSPVLLVVTYPDNQVERGTICGPVGDSPPVVAALELPQVERLCAAALHEPTRHIRVRFLVAMLDGLQEELIPGLRNRGMLQPRSCARESHNGPIGMMLPDE